MTKAAEKPLSGRRILLIIGGGIAAYKSLDLVRRLRERGATVRVVMTAAAQHFITTLSVGAIAGEQPLTDLFDPSDEHDVGHIRLAREAELIVVAPATANLMARMSTGQADDLATAVLLATRAPVLLAPAMNPQMWAHRATQRNIADIARDNVHVIGPNRGEMAESGEAGAGRMAEPVEIAEKAVAILAGGLPLSGRRVLITSGPTHEPIDPVRYIANRSSGKQGHAIAAAAARAGAQVTLVSGPVALADPAGVRTIHVETAREMLAAVEKALPADVAIFAAAVADWRPQSEAAQKTKKGKDGPPALHLVENPDILATVSGLRQSRPPLVIGFAAETEKLAEHARAKLKRKGCDWIVANDVSAAGTSAGSVMGGDLNRVTLFSADGAAEEWPELDKQAVAERLVERISESLR
ncbi:MAG: bifunctional phosphopantothenoylcysteine decarboxylase/phosphopantothenate--cysteine ligase CoaBC [Flavobacteriaceae bacterium]